MIAQLLADVELVYGILAPVKAGQKQITPTEWGVFVACYDEMISGGPPLTTGLRIWAREISQRQCTEEAQPGALTTTGAVANGSDGAALVVSGPKV
jgi:hypothetical protein